MSVTLYAVEDPTMWPCPDIKPRNPYDDVYPLPIPHIKPFELKIGDPVDEFAFLAPLVKVCGDAKLAARMWAACSSVELAVAMWYLADQFECDALEMCERISEICDAIKGVVEG